MAVTFLMGHTHTALLPWKYVQYAYFYFHGNMPVFLLEQKNIFCSSKWQQHPASHGGKKVLFLDKLKTLQKLQIYKNIKPQNKS